MIPILFNETWLYRLLRMAVKLLALDTLCQFDTDCKTNPRKSLFIELYFDIASPCRKFYHLKASSLEKLRTLYITMDPTSLYVKDNIICLEGNHSHN